MPTLVVTNIVPFRDPAGLRAVEVSVSVDCTSDEELDQWRALVGRRVSVEPV